jgi:transcriptional regulator with XRE-family HTH domain
VHVIGATTRGLTLAATAGSKIYSLLYNLAMGASKALGSTLRRVRRERGFSQQELASIAGLTQGHLSQIERGLDAHVSVISRVASALGCEVVLQHVLTEAPYEDDISNRRYALGKLAAQRISADRLQRFREWIDRSSEQHGDYPYFHEWRRIIDNGPARVAAVLRDPTEYGRYMRDVATLLPFVSREERDAVYRA